MRHVQASGPRRFLGVFRYAVSIVLWCGVVGAGVLLAPGPGCGGGKKACEYEPRDSVRALYHVAPGEVAPFPSDMFTVPDDTSPTGRRVALPPGGTPVIEEGLPVVTNADKFLGMLNKLDGFSVWAPIIFPLSGEIDPQSLPATPEESILPGSSVFLADILPGSPEEGQKVPVRVEFRSFEPGEPTEFLLVVQPSAPLLPGGRYAAVVTRGVLDAGGSPVVPAADFSFASGLCPIPDDHPDRDLLEARRDELAPLFDDLGLADREEVAVAVVFTTQSVEHELAAARGVIRDDIAAPQPNLDPDGDGQPDLYVPQDLPDAPADATRFGSVEWVVRGVFQSPEFRNEDGVFQTGPDGAPEIMSMAEIPFILALPADTGRQPFPVVILQHGHGARKEYALYVAGYLAEQGIAVAAIDLVGHGERPNTGHGFLDFDDMEAVRCNFEQSAADVMRLVQVIEAVAAVDFVPGSTGDGVPDLDPGRLAMVGESAGAQVTSMVASLEPSVGAAVMNVGGGGYAVTMERFLGFLEARVLLQFGILVQTLFDRADPLNYYRWYLPQEPSHPENQLLVQEVIDDYVMPNEATELLARVFECPLVRPYAREVEGLQVADPPVARHGLFQFDPAKHGFLLGDSRYPEASDAARRQIASFLSSYFVDGVGIIDNPWQ